MVKYTVRDSKSGKVIRTVENGRITSGGYSDTKGNIQQVVKSSGGGTNVSIVSDSPEDVGKTFSGTKIQSPEEYAQTPSGQALQQAQTQEVVKKIYQDPNRTDITNKSLRSQGFNMEQIAEIGRVQDRQRRQRLYEEELAKKNLSFKEYDEFKKKKGVVSDKEIEGEVERVKFKTEIKKIDADKSKTNLEKEISKRALIGAGSGKGGRNEGLFSEPTTKELRESLNVYGVTPKEQTNKYKKLENYLILENQRIASKPVEKRTKKEMFLVSLYGGAGAGLGTVRKIPSSVLNFLYLTVRPDIVIKSLYQLSTSNEARGQVTASLRELGARARAGDPNAVSTIASEILGYKIGGKIVTESVKIAKTTTPIRKVQEELLLLNIPKNERIFVREILKSARIQEKLKPNDVSRITKINFKEVKELNKIEAEALKKTLKNSESIVFGSLSARTLSKGKTKQPKDVDLATLDTPKEFYSKFVQNIPKNQRKNYEFRKEAVYNKKTGVKILDIKGISRLRPNQTIFGKGLLPVYAKSKGEKALRERLSIPTQKLETIEGIKLIGFGEQTTRKALGTLQVLFEKSSRRAKDPQAFIESLEIQIQGLKKQIKTSNKVKKILLTNKLETLKASVKILKSPKFAKLLESKVKGITKEYPILNKIKKLSNKKIKKIEKAVNKKLISKKEVKPILKKNQLKKSIKKQVSSYLPKSKLKGSYLPRSKLPKSRLPKSTIPKSVIPKSKIPVSKLPKSKLPKSTIPKSVIPKSKIPVSKLPKSRLPKSTIPKSVIPKSKIPVSKLPISKIPVGKKIISPPPIPPKIPKPNLKSTEKKKPIFTKKGLFQYKDTKTKKLVTIRSNLPINKAKKLALKGIDNSIQAKVKVVPYGKTKVKDIKPFSSLKFRFSKSKKATKETLVEKNKFRLDTTGEKKQISFAQAIKKKPIKINIKAKIKTLQVKRPIKRVSRVVKPTMKRKVVSKPIKRVMSKRNNKR